VVRNRSFNSHEASLLLSSSHLVVHKTIKTVLKNVILYCLYCRLFAHPPSQTEIADLAKTALEKYFSSLIEFWAHMEAENQSLRNSAYAMLDFSSFESEPRCNAT